MSGMMQRQVHSLRANEGKATVELHGEGNTSAGIADEVTCPLPLEGTTIADVMRMVEATAMVYKFMQEQHKLDSSFPKQPSIMQDVKRLDELALALSACKHIQDEHKHCHTFIPRW
jgi:hypothetical protein